MAAEPLRLIHFLHVALQEREVPRLDIEVFMKQLHAITDPDKFTPWNRLLTPKEQHLLGQMLRKDANAEKLNRVMLESFRQKLAQHFAITAEEIEEFWQRFGLN